AVDTAPVPMTSTDAPEHLAGHRVAAAWEVPADGFPRPLQLPAPLPSQSVFLAVTPLPTGGAEEPSQEAGVLTTDLGAARIPVAEDAASAASWSQDPGGAAGRVVPTSV